MDCSGQRDDQPSKHGVVTTQSSQDSEMGGDCSGECMPPNTVPPVNSSETGEDETEQPDNAGQSSEVTQLFDAGGWPILRPLVVDTDAEGLPIYSKPQGSAETGVEMEIDQPASGGSPVLVDDEVHDTAGVTATPRDPVLGCNEDLSICDKLRIWRLGAGRPGTKKRKNSSDADI